MSWRSPAEVFVWAALLSVGGGGGESRGVLVPCDPPREGTAKGTFTYLSSMAHVRRVAIEE